MTDTLYGAAETAFEAAADRAYPLGAVPDKPTYPYLVWSISQDEPTAYTLEAAFGLQFHRVTWQSFSKTLTFARSLDAAATAALLDQRFTADGFDCGPCSTERGGILGRVVRDPNDDGVVAITSSLTFTATAAPIEE